MQKQNLLKERTGASLKPETHTPSFVLDIPVVVIDGGSGTERVSFRYGVEARLPEAEAEEALCCSQGDGGAQTGGAAVLDMENTTALHLPLARRVARVIPWLKLRPCICVGALPPK